MNSHAHSMVSPSPSGTRLYGLFVFVQLACSKLTHTKVDRNKVKCSYLLKNKTKSGSTVYCLLFSVSFFSFLAFFCTASVSVSVFGYFLIYLFRFSCVVVFVGLQPATAPTALLDFFSFVSLLYSFAVFKDIRRHFLSFVFVFCACENNKLLGQSVKGIPGISRACIKGENNSLEISANSDLSKWECVCVVKCLALNTKLSELNKM